MAMWNLPEGVYIFGDVGGVQIFFERFGGLRQVREKHRLKMLQYQATNTYTFEGGNIFLMV